MRVEGPQYENGQKKSQNQLLKKLTSSSHWRVKMDVKSVLGTVVTVEALFVRPGALGFRIRLEKLKIRINSVRGERELIAAYQRWGSAVLRYEGSYRHRALYARGRESIGGPNPSTRRFTLGGGLWRLTVF